MAKYKKRADGRYSASVVVGYHDNGKPKRKYFYTKTVKELENQLAEFKSLQNKGLIFDDKGLTVEVWSDRWLKLYKSTKAFNTQQTYTDMLNRYILPCIGDVRLSQLKKCMVQELLNNIISKGCYRSAEMTLLTIRQMITAAIEEQYIYVDVTKGIKLPKKPYKEKRVLTDAEYDRLQTAALSPKQRLFVDILLYTGLRRGEALALRHSDIDIENKVLSVNKTVVFKDNDAEIKPTPKSTSGIRSIPIPDILLQSINENIGQCGADYIFTMEKADGLVTKSSYNKLWKSIVHAAELPMGVSAHTLRHNYATKLYYAGVDIKTAQMLMGHSSIQITLDIYTHLSSDTSAAAEKINNIF